MSLKQFPSHGAWTGESKHKVDPGEEKPAARNVAQVFDVDEAWEMLEKKRGEVGEEMAQIEGLAALGRLDAARIAAAAGLKVDANFTIAQAVESFRKIKFREIQCYFLFLTIFAFGFVIRADRHRANILHNTIVDGLMEAPFLGADGQYKTFNQIASPEDVWAYTQNGMPHFLFANNKHDPKTLSPGLESNSSTDLLWIMKYNLLVQPMRIRQLRSLQVPLAECAIAIRLTNDRIECWPRYTPDTEDTTPIPGWPSGSSLEYKTELDLLTAPYSRFTTTTYSGGGFVIDVPQLTTESEYHLMFNHLRENGWTSKATRVIFYDLCMYNPTLRFYVSVRLAFEFLPSGSVLASKSFRTFKGPSLSGASWDVAGFYLQQIVYLAVLGLLVWDCIKLRQMGARFHFSNPWNSLAMANYAVFFVAYSASSGFMGSDAFAFYAAEADGVEVPQVEVFDFEALGAQHNYYECLTGLNALLSWIRVLEYIKYFHLGISQLLSTTAKCAADCSVWILMLAIIVFAYAQAFYLSFGPDIAGFNTFGEALATMTAWSFNVIDLSAILSADQVLASLLFVSFQVIFTVVLVNMFIVILMRSYAERSAKHELDPIAAEVRKSIKIKVLRASERIMQWLPAVPVPKDEDYEEEMLRQEDDAAAKEGTSLLGHEGAVKMSDVRTVLAQVQTAHLEVKFLGDRVAEACKKQAALNQSSELELERQRRGAMMAQYRDASGRLKLNVTNRSTSDASAVMRRSSSGGSAAHVAVSGEGFGGWGGDSARGLNGGGIRGLGRGHGGVHEGRTGRGGVDVRAYKGLEMAWLPSNTMVSAPPGSGESAAMIEGSNPFLVVDG